MSESQNTPFDHSATYSPEDNKLRLYFGARIPKEQWNALKAQGWTWTMKQDSDMCAHWTPEREDQALELAGYIGAEESSRDERAADRAERFAGYLDKRLDEAQAHAHNYESGPDMHGHQSQAKAEAAAHRVIMNPPFKQGRDIKHIMHAYSFLKPGGRLVALCYDGVKQNEKLKPWADSWQPLGQAFKSEGTGASVCLLIKNKPLTTGGHALQL